MPANSQVGMVLGAVQGNSSTRPVGPVVPPRTPGFVTNVDARALTEPAAFEAYVAGVLGERNEVAARTGGFVPMTTLWWVEGAAARQASEAHGRRTAGREQPTAVRGGRHGDLAARQAAAHQQRAHLDELLLRDVIGARPGGVRAGDIAGEAGPEEIGVPVRPAQPSCRPLSVAESVHFAVVAVPEVCSQLFLVDLAEWCEREGVHEFEALRGVYRSLTVANERGEPWAVTVASGVGTTNAATASPHFGSGTLMRACTVSGVNLIKGTPDE